MKGNWGARGLRLLLILKILSKKFRTGLIEFTGWEGCSITDRHVLYDEVFGLVLGNPWCSFELRKRWNY
jgi:hypothetical protein